VNLKSGSRYGLLILAAASVTYFTESFLRSVPSALTPVLMGELGLTHTGAGLLISSYSFIYALMQVPGGLLGDSFGPRKVILSFTVLTIAGTFLFYASRSVEALTAAQLLIGLGASVFYINAVKIVSSWFGSERRASAIGALSASSGLGHFVSYMGFPIAVSLLGGWRTLYLYVCALMVANFVVNFAVLRDGPGVRNVHNPDRLPVGAALRGVLLDRKLYPLLFGYIFMSSNWALLSWMPQFLTDAGRLSYLEVGVVSSAATIMVIPGCIALGIVSDRLRRRKLPLVLFSVVSTALMALLFVLPSGTSTLVFTAVSGAVGLSFSTWVLVVAMIPEVLPPSTAGVGLGLTNGLGTLSFSIVTAVYGALVDSTGAYVASNGLLLAMEAVATIVFLLFTRETYGGAERT
jgi:predicted MFS family arabinose efflux permease